MSARCCQLNGFFGLGGWKAEVITTTTTCRQFESTARKPSSCRRLNGANRPISTAVSSFRIRTAARPIAEDSPAVAAKEVGGSSFHLRTIHRQAGIRARVRVHGCRPLAALSARSDGAAGRSGISFARPPQTEEWNDRQGRRRTRPDDDSPAPSDAGAARASRCRLAAGHGADARHGAGRAAAGRGEICDHQGAGARQPPAPGQFAAATDGRPPGRLSPDEGRPGTSDGGAPLLPRRSTRTSRNASSSTATARAPAQRHRVHHLGEALLRRCRKRRRPTGIRTTRRS